MIRLRSFWALLISSYLFLQANVFTSCPNYCQLGNCKALQDIEACLAQCQIEDMEPCLKQYDGLLHRKYRGQPFYVLLHRVHPTVTQFSAARVQQSTAIFKQILRYDVGSKTWQLPEDAGKSLYSLDDALPVIKGPAGFYLIGDHHKVIAALEFNATTLPVRIIENINIFIEDLFWEEMVKKNYAFLQTPQGQLSRAPRTFQNMTDDPVYDYVVRTARYCRKLSHERSVGAEYPLWVKKGSDPKFAEFIITNILARKGFTPEESKSSAPPTKDHLRGYSNFLNYRKNMGLKATMPAVGPNDFPDKGLPPATYEMAYKILEKEFSYPGFTLVTKRDRYDKSTTVKAACGV